MRLDGGWRDPASATDVSSAVRRTIIIQTCAAQRRALAALRIRAATRIAGLGLSTRVVGARRVGRLDRDGLRNPVWVSDIRVRAGGHGATIARGAGHPQERRRTESSL
jgi:hypothetical protein